MFGTSEILGLVFIFQDIILNLMKTKRKEKIKVKKKKHECGRTEGEHPEDHTLQPQASELTVGRRCHPEL